ncbi:LacI family DNA-binding transcriptional regulator [Cryobacterium sp. Y82]|uniref:LacI family DNA-binding transcriptional regulator n=1 Tax=Cryobacterium sp. Y82 TaxID=2045017 RepID=UPI001E2C0016|nr:substrate-binding domain-containing protein [Cryobacterium sp. Y82]
MGVEQGRPVTLRMIAEEVGVHVSTVSRVLTAADADVSRWAAPNTAERIRDTARKRGYHRNVYASNLRTARSNLVGVIVPRLQDFVLATVYEGIEEAAIENGLSTFVTNSLDREEDQRTRTEMMLERRVGGLIFGDAHLDNPFLDEIRSRGVPTVLVSRHSGDHVSVTCNDYLGGRLVGEHLLALGRRDVAILAGMSFASTGQDRTQGVIDAYRDAGILIPPDRVVHGGFDAAGGRAGAEAILATRKYPDAIFATNDFAAIGALGVLRDRGLSVPDDVALVGYNDTPLAREMMVPLTTVRSPMHQMGRRALEMLISVMDGKTISSERLEPTLIIRTSTSARADETG